MSKPVAWFRTVFGLLLIACAISASAQSSGGTLAVSLQVVPSTVLLYGDDGKTRIIEANGINGLTITTIDAPAGVARTDASTTTAPQTQPATQTPPAGTSSK